MPVNASTPSYEQTCSALKTETDSLPTFAAIAAWDRRAQAEIDGMMAATAAADQSVELCKGKLEQAMKERASKSIIQRTLMGRSAEKDLARAIAQHDAVRRRLEPLIASLQEAIDMTPNDAQEQKQLLQELRARKKELQLQKKDLAADMKAIRVSARTHSSDAGRVLGVLYDPKLAATQRRNIRYQREAALRPNEDRMAALERQITGLDQIILWVERLK